MSLLPILKAICPGGRPDLMEGFAAELERSGDTHGLGADHPLRRAHFMAQCAHESDGFRTFQEYASGAAYEGRKDLGNVKRGDGALFKGRGPIQITGRANYQRFGQALGIELVRDPVQAARPDIGTKIALAYWDDRGLSVAADRDDIRTVTKRINGGYNGLAQRQQYLARAKAALGLQEPPPAAAQPLGLLGGGLVEPPAQGKVKAVQERLEALGYHMVGQPDGQIGPRTIAALSAFQAENDIPVSGELDPVTENALWSADPHLVPDERAFGKPADSSILKTAAKLRNGAAVGGVGGGALLQAMPTDPGAILDKAEQAHSYWSRVQGLLSPFAGLKSFVTANPGLVLMAGAAVVIALAHLIYKARLADFRTGKTP
jgi:putative chitinase